MRPRHYALSLFAGVPTVLCLAASLSGCGGTKKLIAYNSKENESRAPNATLYIGNQRIEPSPSPSPTPTPGASGSPTPSPSPTSSAITSNIPVVEVKAPVDALVLRCDATDPDQDPLTFSWDGANADTVHGNRIATLTTTTAGYHRVSCIVSDDRGKSTTVSVVVRVIPGENQAPRNLVITPGATTVAPGSAVDIRATAFDPENDTLSYQWNTTQGTITQDASDQAHIVLAAPATEGTVTVACTVSDGNGGTITRLVTLIVKKEATS